MAREQWTRPVKFEIPRRAMPRYLADMQPSEEDWRDVPPGHRFQLYFHGWADFGELRYRDETHWKTAKSRVRGAAERGDWPVLEREGGEIRSRGPLQERKRVALEAACGMGEAARATLEALEVRAAALAGTDTWTCDVRLLAPLATGLGLPHPVENGFSFCSPYGVPFLPGSAAKGVFRRAAELAALEDDSAWNPVRVWALFGFDATSEWFDPARGEAERYLDWCSGSWNDEAEREAEAWAENIRPQLPPNWRDRAAREIFRAFADKGEDLRRAVHWQGLLVFHDAFPSPDATMGVDILNPHHKDYYSGQVPGATPDDAENPVPVYFLVLNPGCTLALRVSCPRREAPLWGALGGVWRDLLDAIAEPAAKELGFGAKTRVGYGYGALAPEVAEARQRVADERRRAEELARYPWREHLPRLESVDNWGELRQLAEGPLAPYLHESEVADAVEAKAKDVSRGKWDESRDKVVAGWLERAGKTWSRSGTPAEAVDLPAEELEMVERIRALSDWGAWKTAGLSIEQLGPAALTELERKFIEWKCDNRKAKKDKVAAWKALQKAKARLGR